MSYVELYKRAKPMIWDDLIGQEKVVSTLQTAIRQDAIPTAYLFSGPRGSGKTSSAFLLAKTINCENPQTSKDSSGRPIIDPCNECNICTQINAGNPLPGFNYESMANNGGVDALRKIVEKAKHRQPIKHQVWILDEVHNLSPAAFDSLLIPLEDPNMTTLFILCTTEVNKIPDTISSRVQARRFGLIGADKMKPYIEDLLNTEGLSADGDLIDSAIKMGRGSVRDTLSSLEEVMSSGEGGASFTEQLFSAIANLDMSGVLKVRRDADEDGVDFTYFAEDLLEDFSDLLLYASGDKSVAPKLPTTNPDELCKALYGPKGIILLMRKISTAITEMGRGVDPKMSLELGLVEALFTISSAKNK